MPGVQEFLPEDQVVFQRMLDTIRQSYERFGFLPVETPVMEFLEVLLTKSGGETEKQVYFAQSTGSRNQGKEPELGLRFDLTVPLARYVAEHQNKLRFPFRRYQMQRVYRGERVQRGRYREFYQCDIDIIDRDTLSLEFDAEIPVVLDHTFRSLDVGEFTIHLNNRNLLRGLLDAFGVSDERQQTLVLREIDKLDKKGQEAVVESLGGSEIGLAKDVAEGLLQRIQGEGSSAQVLETVANGVSSELLEKGLQELSDVVSAIHDHGVSENRIRVNPSIARGLDYYTGTVYETTLNDHPGLGSVCSGGRYENLAAQYTDSLLPGVGISIGASRLFTGLRESGWGGQRATTVQVLVTQMSEELRPQARRVASLVREAGLNAEVFPRVAKIAKQMKYADKSGIPLVVIVGDDEAAQGTAVLKNMVSGNQESVPVDQLSALARDWLIAKQGE